MAKAPLPFSVDVAQAALDDLKTRLGQPRFAIDPVNAAPGTLGTDPAFLKETVAYWRNDFDWRAAEARLNAHPQFTAPVTAAGRSCDIHFYHVRSANPDALPLILIHGWPGSVVEYLDLIEPLAKHFHIIVPSLPGYGFSGRPADVHGPRAIAGLLHALMTDVLGYERYGAQGGDWGSIIASWMALEHADAVAGLHLHMVGVRPGIADGDRPFDEEEKAWLKQATPMMRLGRGYREQQATRPTTLGHALVDSPSGLAAWILDKFDAWSDPRPGQLWSRFDRDAVLTNIALYWLSGNADAALWIYYGAREDGSLAFPTGTRVEVPTAIAAMPCDLVPPPPRQWAERAYAVVRWTDMPAGGHFATLEAPAALIEDITGFFDGLD